MSMKFRVGTRGSKLSRMQTEEFLRELQMARPEAEFEVQIIKTLGDTERIKPLFKIDSKGIFEKEIDQALVNGEVDFAISSLKDVPAAEGAETVIAAVPKRASVHDVLVSRDRVPLKALPKGAVVGTGSLRRLAMVKHVRPDLNVKPIRGNVDTRLQKVRRGEVDAVIVAEAGLERMCHIAQNAERLPLDQFPSAPGQGALAIVAKRGNTEVIRFLSAAEHPQTRAEVTAERSLMLQLGGGCRVPVGAVGHVESNVLSLRGVLYTLDGENKVEATATSAIMNAEKLGKTVAEALVKQGAKEIEKEWREKYGPW